MQDSFLFSDFLILTLVYNSALEKEIPEYLTEFLATLIFSTNVFLTLKAAYIFTWESFFFTEFLFKPLCTMMP